MSKLAVIHVRFREQSGHYAGRRRCLLMTSPDIPARMEAASWPLVAASSRTQAPLRLVEHLFATLALGQVEQRNQPLRRRFAPTRRRQGCS